MTFIFVPCKRNSKVVIDMTDARHIIYLGLWSLSEQQNNLASPGYGKKKCLFIYIYRHYSYSYSVCTKNENVCLPYVGHIGPNSFLTNYKHNKDNN